VAASARNSLRCSLLLFRNTIDSDGASSWPGSGDADRSRAAGQDRLSEGKTANFPVRRRPARYRCLLKHDFFPSKARAVVRIAVDRIHQEKARAK
jgi:hypothetical protein